MADEVMSEDTNLIDDDDVHGLRTLFTAQYNTHTASKSGYSEPEGPTRSYPSSQLRLSLDDTAQKETIEPEYDRDFCDVHHLRGPAFINSESIYGIPTRREAAPSREVDAGVRLAGEGASNDTSPPPYFPYA